ncbi:MAG: DUF3142 domain-containing protein [Algicola sp.]|nr:DUF3142 domain-containing protein [Algicola sp.]
MLNIKDLLKFVRHLHVWLPLFCVSILCLLSVLSLSWPINTTPPQKVELQHWIWQAQDMEFIEQSDGIVIMQGEFQQVDNQVVFVKKGLAPHPVKFQGSVRLLVRVYALPPVAEFIAQVNYLLQNWQHSGTSVAGIQVDYDSPAAQLDHYHRYLQKVSHHYGREFISITGLSSWLADNLPALNRFGDVVDYVAIQFYQYHLPVPQVEQHIARLPRLKVPYKVGITTAPRFAELQFNDSPYYTGKLIFLNTRKLL